AQAHLFAACALLDLLPEPLNALTALADHDAGLGGVNRHRDIASHPLDLNLRDGGIGQTLVDLRANLAIFREQVFVVTPRIPARLPAFDHTQTKAGRMYFLPQSSASS